MYIYLGKAEKQKSAGRDHDQIIQAKGPEIISIIRKQTKTKNIIQETGRKSYTVIIIYKEGQNPEIRKQAGVISKNVIFIRKRSH